jgi:hypothetical protein
MALQNASTFTPSAAQLGIRHQHVFTHSYLPSKSRPPGIVVAYRGVIPLTQAA